VNALQFAFYREARTRMTPEELERAKAFAAKADKGDQGAASALQTLVNVVLNDHSRLEDSDDE